MKSRTTETHSGVAPLVDRAARGTRHAVRKVDREQRLLLALLSPGVGENGEGRLDELLREEPDWELLLRLARTQEMLPLLHHNLAGRRDVLPAEAAARLKAAYHAATLRNLMMAAKLVQMIDLLEAAGVQAVPFKGPLLAVQAYGHLSLRSFSDLDVMVRPRDFERAFGVLTENGYLAEKPAEAVAAEAVAAREIYNRCLVDPEEKVLIELHHSFMGPRYSFRPDLERMWRRLQPVEISGRTVRGFAPEELLLVLSVHGSKHLWERLLWVRDVAGLVHNTPRLDWNRTLEETRRLGTVRILFVSLLLADRAFGTAVPEELRVKVAGDETAGRLAEEVLERLVDGLTEEPRPAEEDLHSEEILSYYVRVRERPRDRFRYSFELFRLRLRPTARDRESLPLPRPFFFLHYVLRPFRLLGEYGWSSLKRYFVGLFRMLREM